ncbi:hypothetical protein SAMN05444748_103222 [Variovorax sp. OV700]|nr:hypothetical protein SAMN05444748_103222 [Variovorax sp. OV700]
MDFILINSGPSVDRKKFPPIIRFCKTKHMTPFLISSVDQVSIGSTQIPNKSGLPKIIISPYIQALVAL